MNQDQLIDTLAGSASTAAAITQADVIALAPPSLDEARARAQRFLNVLQEQDLCAHDRADWNVRDDHTLIQLAQGARAIVYHASGALRFVSGLAPLEGLFGKVEEREALLRQIEGLAKRLDVAAWTGERAELRFERLWLSKAQGADRNDRRSEAVLVRAVGAYRQYLGGLPVLGAASAALKLAGDGQLDGLAIHMRAGSGEVLDTPALLAPELGARQLVLQLLSVLGRARNRLPDDVVQSATMQLGYLDLGKRKVQRVLAPVYVAQVVLKHEMERQAYVLAVPATEQAYQPLPLYGTEAVITRSRANAPCADSLR